MIDEFKNFWSKYKPYRLHPDDEESIYNSKKGEIIKNNPDAFMVHKDFKTLKKIFSNDLKNKKHNTIFQESFNSKAIHTNLYCKTFIGNVENAKLIILYGNPGLELGDYKDEHEDQNVISELDNDIKFKSNGFLFLRDIAKETGGYDYWKNGNRFKKIIERYADAKGISNQESYNFLLKNICLIESIGYHSTKTPLLEPTDLASSLISRKLVHNYFLPKARNNELIIFSWRQSSFWGLNSESNVIIRDPNKAINPYFSSIENNFIVNFLESL